MSESYEIVVEVSDADAKRLDEFSDERIESAVEAALEQLTTAEEKRDELRRRRLTEVSGEDSEELSGEELEEAMREFVRGDRKQDPRL